MLIVLSCRIAIFQVVVEVYLACVAPLGALTHKITHYLFKYYYISLRTTGR